MRKKSYFAWNKKFMIRSTSVVGFGLFCFSSDSGLHKRNALGDADEFW